MREKIVVSVADQALMSAFNFGLNLVLLKFWSAEQFGLYTLIFGSSFLLLSVQNALINTPYAVLVPASKQPNQVRHTLAAANVAIILLLCVSVLLLLKLPLFSLGTLSPAVIVAYMASRLIREYLRARWAAELQMLPILRTDIAFTVVAIAIAVVLWGYLGEEGFDIEVLLWVLTASHVITMPFMLNQECQLLKRVNWQATVTGYMPIWQQSKWSLLGAMTTEVQNRGYIVLVGALFGTAALGFVQAGRVLFGPINLFTAAWVRVARPMLAKHYGANEPEQFSAITQNGALIFLLFNVLFAVVLWLLWPYLYDFLYASSYPDIGWVVALWAMVTAVFHVRGVFSAAVQATNNFKPLAFATIWGAMISSSLLVMLSWLAATKWIVSSVLLAELFVLAYVFMLYQSGLNKRLDLGRQL